MRASVRHPIAFAVATLAVVLSGPTLAQSDSAPGGANPTEEAEEITVRGRKTLTQYRLELEEAREEMIRVFNEENSNDANDVTCTNERPTGSRMPQRICRSNAQSSADAAAARGFLSSLFAGAGTAMGAQGRIDAAASQVEGLAGDAAARAELDEELQRLQKENRRVYRAAVKYVELADEYNKAREEPAP